MTGHDFNFGFVQLACLSTLYYYRYRARDANFKGKEIFHSTFSINDLRSFFSSPFYSSLLGTKREESKTERKIKRERERGRLSWILSSKTSERTNKRQKRSWSCVAYQTPWYHIRVANVSLSKVPTYSLGPPLAPCPTRTPAPLDFQLPAPLTYTHL